MINNNTNALCFVDSNFHESGILKAGWETGTIQKEGFEK